MLAMSGSAHASLTDRCGASTNHLDPTTFACSKTLTDELRYQVLGQDWRSYAARWELPDGTQFVATGGHHPWCHLYGRYANIRVKENSCGGNLIVSARTTDESPVRVTFEWEAN